MKNEELRALRQEIGLPVEWCAERVGGVARRTWTYWEQAREGKDVPIPDDVQRRMLALKTAIAQALKTT